MNKEFSKIWKIMIIVTAIIFISINVISYLSPKNHSSRDSFRKYISDKKVKNKVERIYFDRNNHGTAYAVYKKDSIELFGSDWGERVSVGDSLIKPKGSLKMKVKKTTRENFILDFEESTKNL